MDLRCPRCGEPLEKEFAPFVQGVSRAGDPRGRRNQWHCRCEECDAEYIYDSMTKRFSLLDSRDLNQENQWPNITT